MSNLAAGPTRGKPFIKGQVANPGGRPPGLPDRRTRYREIIEQRMPELLERCVSMALQGDIQALRLCLETTCGKFFCILQGLLGINQFPPHHFKAFALLASGSAIPALMDSRMPGTASKNKVS